MRTELNSLNKKEKLSSHDASNFVRNNGVATQSWVEIQVATQEDIQECAHEKTRQEAIQLQSPISFKLLDTNAGLRE